MRLLIIILLLPLSFFPTQAIANAKADTELLYYEVLESGMVLIKLLEKDYEQPEEFADIVEEFVNAPISQAEQDWLDAAFNSGNNSEPYQQYQPCMDAAYALGQYGAKIQRYLRQLDKEPFGEKHVQPFRDALAKCEIVLEKKITFNEQSN